MPDNNGLLNLAESGGLAVVILGANIDVPREIHEHAQVLTIHASDLPSDRDKLNAELPAQTKLVAIGGELPAVTYTALKNVLDRRAVTYVHRRSEQALVETIRAALPAHKVWAPPPMPPQPANATAPEPEGQRKGAIADFARAEADLSKGSAEEARRIFGIAQKRGITTTVASLAQAISVLKRKGGRTETPRSIQSSQAKALTTLDEAIAGLQLIREYVQETEELNATLKKKLAAMAAVLAGN